MGPGLEIEEPEVWPPSAQFRSWDDAQESQGAGWMSGLGSLEEALWLLAGEGMWRGAESPSHSPALVVAGPWGGMEPLGRGHGGEGPSRTGG